MASDYTDLKAPLPNSRNLPSDCTERDQDSESMYSSVSECRSSVSECRSSVSECRSSVSECHSSAESDASSSLNSASHDIPTVRTKPDGGDNEIERLISAAETLAIERAKLNIRSFIPATDAINHRPAPVVGDKSLSLSSRLFQKQPQKLYKYLENKDLCEVVIPVQNNTGITNSVPVNNGDDILHYSGMIPNKNADSKELSKSTVSEDRPKNLNNLGLSEGKGYSIPEDNGNFENSSSSSIPRLQLELSASPNNISDIKDEKNAVSKDVKDVCNSTIRESSVDGYETLTVPLIKNCRELGNSRQSSLQTSEDLREVSLMVHDECSGLLSLALAATSSLNCVIRLLRQVSTLQLGVDTPRVTKNVLEELSEYEDQHSSLETRLSAAAAQLQMAVAQVQGIEIIIGEQEREASRVEECASRLLAQVEAGLESNGLKHMVAVTSPRRRSTARMIDDIASALTLLLGELNRKSLRNCNMEVELARHYEEIQLLREALLKEEKRLRAVELELTRAKEQSKAEAASLKQCLAQAEENLHDTQLEKMKLSETSKKQAVENGVMIIQLQHKLTDLQRETDSIVSNLEHRLQATAKEKQALESTSEELKNQLRLRTKQSNLVEEENNLLIEGLRVTIRRQQNEMDQLRQQLDSTSGQKNDLSRRVNELESELSTEQEQHQNLIKDASDLKTSISNLKLEHTGVEKTLRDKLNESLATQCELEGRIRSLDLIVLQLRTELQMEKHRSTALSDETSSLHKKVKDLQERVWSQTRRQRNNSSDSIRSGDSMKSSSGHRSTGDSAWGKHASPEFSSYLSLLPSAASNDKVDQQVQCMMKEVGDGQAREEHLHTLLREKDAALHSLQYSLSTQITAKNHELEELTGKVTFLEDQLGSLLSGLEVSAAIGNITTEVGRLLQDRTSHLDSLDDSSHWLQEEMSSLALENQTLNNQLLAVKRNEEDARQEAQESARRARQEAREERLAAVRLREKCLQLQTKLDSLQFTLNQERDERRLSETVHGIKHQEFGSLLESTAVLQQTLENQECNANILGSLHSSINP
ncbi:uncharacterized protein [Cherax quadricarinatus]|uniref:uncharacterized protein isoform X2 n=1 Tax=Cherax quadricarinatus TaxID=27406 RepID=UPI00387EA68A